MVTLLAFAAGLYLWMFLHVILHEGGHVLAAKAVGFAPLSFTVGTGPLLLEHRVGNVRVRVCCIPAFGMVQARLMLHGLRWKGAVFSAGGPLIDILLLALLLNLTGFHAGAGLPRADEAWFAKSFFATLAAYQAILLAITLIPMEMLLQGAKLPNDGRQIVSYLAGSTSRTLKEYETAVAAYDPKFRIADSWILRGEPSLLLLLSAGEQDIAAGRYAAATEKYLRVIGEADMAEAERARFLDRIASLPVFHGDKSFLPAAETWARRASTSFPGCKTIRGTLGSILVEKGECAEGMALLMPLTSEDNSQVDRTLASCYLAKAFHRLGNAAAAARWLEAARSSGGFPAVVSRIEGELALA